MKLSVILFYIGYLAVVAGKRNGRQKNPRNSNDCFDPANLKSYIGKTAITVHGQTCQKWNANSPHRPKHQPSPDINHNFCRNPDDDPNGPWCYTTNPNVRFDYCHVTHCNDHGAKQKIPGKTCLPNDDLTGQNYEGTHRFAKINGKTLMCQSWAAVQPHRSMYLNTETHNYCRNPDNNIDGPWCYVHDQKLKKGPCTGIPLCEGRRIKSGSCGVPHVEASFSKAAEPTQLRVRRSGDKAHVDNANERYNHADYEYAEYSTGDTEVVRTKTFIGDLISRNDTTTLSRIVGGEEVVPNSFPWQVSLRYKSERLAFCGGSIVSDKWVLTAAHCVMDEPTGTRDGEGCFRAVPNLEIYAGTHTKMGTNAASDKHRQFRDVRRFCMHPKWNQNEIYGDAAILEVKSNFVINDYVLPICLPQQDVIVKKGTMCVITGFGRTQKTANENVLNQQTTPIVSNTKCNHYLGAGTVPDNSQMCAGYDEGGIDTCQGDSGGPLACKHGDEWTIDGITSWGYGCGDAKSPGVYTRVSSNIILSWIKRKTGII